nr:hypothetical protein [Tanacetum cinerariifolium]
MRKTMLKQEFSEFIEVSQCTSSFLVSSGSNGDGRIGHQMADSYALTKDQQLGHFARECNVKKVDENARYSAFKILEEKTKEPKAMSDFIDHAGNATGSVSDAAAEFAMMGISSKEWEVKLVESLARFDKWKESSKNLVKLINSSMSSRTKLSLGFKETIGSDEVFDLSTPSVFDPEPENREVKSLYESDKSSESETSDFASCVSRPNTNDSSFTIHVKILPKSDVKDPIPTNSIPSCSFNENVKPPRNLCNKSGIADRIHCKNNFVLTKTCFVCGSKTHLIKDCDVYDNVPSVVSKAASIPAGSRNSSASISAGRSIPAASRNRPASIHAELANPEQTATGKDVSNPLMAVMVCQKLLGYSSSPMIHVPRAGLVIHPPG